MLGNMHTRTHNVACPAKYPEIIWFIVVNDLILMIDMCSLPGNGFTTFLTRGKVCSVSVINHFTVFID